jgi:exopolyphosphatase/pppGpp-phosphohydrolase
MNNFERLDRYLNSETGPYVCIFDIGTRAARILVGPKQVPTHSWGPGAFFNDALLTNLGAEVNRYHKNIDVNSETLGKIINFIKEYKQFLRDRNVAENDFSAVGTAVFRWMKNLNEVLKVIRDKTDVDIRVIEDNEEAFFSTASLFMTYKFRRDTSTSNEFNSNDALVLLDQGGGSMEVSYSLIGHQDKSQVKSFDELGTIALRNKFFTDGLEGRVDPGSNQRQIKKQNERITEFIEDRIKQWTGFPELEGKQVHIYAMGSAITNCVNGNNYKIHNKELKKGEIEKRVEECCSSLEASQSQVRTLYKALQNLKNEEQKSKLDNLLVTLYGLPVYIKMMDRLGADHLRISGYALRYGIYVLKYHYGIYP